ncbi:CPBP family intramembrane glutamic endopeptidase [Stomatohabitans albus]|uniref:CPBP family intramembrane glutamic endopeptidase n=1 Tax=Stomatohabitans albus TaxID=3110766 RepID=UPI00300D34D9
MSYSTRQIIVFLSVAFGGAWAVWLLLYVVTKNNQDPSFVSSLAFITSVMAMWSPALGVLVLWLSNKRKRVLTPSLQFHIRNRWKVYLAAWLVPIGCVLLGALGFFLLLPHDLDLSLSGMRQSLQLPSETVPDEAIPSIVGISLVSGVFIAPIINTLPALGEELGWRGFLYPALAERLRPRYAHLIMGVIWGFWHTPINTMGHNYATEYPGYPWLGIIVMSVFCFGAGTFLSYLTERSGTIWPAALGHGTINAVGGFPVIIATNDLPHRIFGPGISGLIVSLPFVLLAAWLIPRFQRTEQFPIQEEGVGG